MKKVVLCAFVIVLMIPMFAVAETPQDFGMGYIDFLTSLSSYSSFDAGNLNMSDFSFYPDGNYIYFDYDDFSMMLTVNPQTRYVSEISIGYPQSKISSTAQSYGLLIGNILSVVSPTLTIDSVHDIFAELGLLSESVLLSDNYYSQTVSYDEYSYSFVVFPSSDRFYLKVGCKDTPIVECDVHISDAELLFIKMMHYVASDVSAYYTYDEDTDPNGTFGDHSSYGSKLNFASKSISPDATFSSSLSVDDGGSIEVFYNSSDLFQRVTTLYQLGYFEPQLSCTTVWKNNYLLRLSYQMDSSSIAEYTNAFYASFE